MVPTSTNIDSFYSNSLRQALFRLRRALRPDAIEDSGGRLILHLAVSVDLAEVEAHLHEGRLTAALEQVTGMPLWFTILCTGFITTIYTTFGGMRAVIWTDVMQLIVLFGGMMPPASAIAIRSSIFRSLRSW